MYMPKSAVPIDDSDASSGYMPKSAVPINEGTNGTPQAEGFLSKALNAAIPGLGTLGSIVAQNPHMILPGLANIAKSVPSALAQQGAGLMSAVLPAPISNIATSLAQEVPTPSPEASRLLGVGANTALGASGLEALPELGALGAAGGKALLSKLENSPILKNISGKNIQEATENFSNEAKNTFNNLLGASPISPSDQLQQGTRDVLNKLYPNSAASPPEVLAANADNVLQKMYGTPDYKNLIGNENQILSQHVFNAHQQNYALGSARFDQTLSDTNPIISPEDAHINPAESAKLEKAMNMDPLLADKIITANETPNLRNLHEVQSQMGAMIADKKSVPYSQRDNESINVLSDLRNGIINNISNYAPQYKDDQAFWKNNVIPYYQNSSINKLVRQGVQPANIGNILSKPELATQPNQVPGTVNTILSHLTPQQKQLIPLSKLGGSQGNPLMDLSGNINYENFAKNSQGLTSKNISQFITPDIRQQLMEMGNNLKDAKSYNAITNNVTDNLGNVDPQKLVSNMKNLDLSSMNSGQKSILQNSLGSLNDLSTNAKLQNAVTNNVQDLSGNVDPNQLIFNLRNIDSSLLTGGQKQTLQNALSKLTGLSQNVEKQQQKSDLYKDYLKKTGVGALILGGYEGGKRIFPG